MLMKRKASASEVFIFILLIVGIAGLGMYFIKTVDKTRSTIIAQKVEKGGVSIDGYSRVYEIKLKDGTRCAIITSDTSSDVGGITCDWK